jgi:poly(3-hydroxybutyrate) depolymerase
MASKAISSPEQIAVIINPFQMSNSSIAVPPIYPKLQIRLFDMFYSFYQSQTDLTSPVRWMARAAGDALHPPWPGLPDIGVKRRMAAACQVLAAMGTTHTRPDFGIATVTVGNESVPVREEAVCRTPFCTLVRFRKDVAVSEPRVLVVAPMSGHFATLLRGTVRTLLPEHDVHITD